MTNSLALYIHIPFCTQKCSYCAFTSFAPQTKQIENYFNALLKEVQLASNNYKNKKVDTIFIGGGTPSYVKSGFIAKLVNLIKLNYKVTKECEITIEANPESINKEKLQEYKKVGINRLSIGCQTTNKKLLKLLNRAHSKKQFLHAVKLAKQQGFNNINADLIIGLPTQKLKHVKKDVKKLTKLGLTHLSVYDLILEENTPFSNKVKSGKLQPLSEKLTLKMQDYVVKKLNKRKYMRYEVSAYSKKGYKSAHNLKYWQGKDYLGLGLSSHSKISDTRFFNTSNLNTYINNVTNNGELKYENKHILTKKEKQEEYIMLGLRKTEGINIKEYNKLFKKDLLNDKQKKIEMLLIKGLIKFRNDQLQLTNKGFNVLNNIILQLI